MRYCHHRQCGSPVPAVARFCPRCGGRVKRGGGPKWFIIPLAVVGGVMFMRLAAPTRHYSSPQAVPAVEVSDTNVRQARPYGSPFSHTPMHP